MAHHETKSTDAQRFALLRHEMPENTGRESHFDLMLESEGELLTWAIDKIPSGSVVAKATQLANHRIDYLHYEGDISGNRGSVRRLDHGTYRMIARSEALFQIHIKGARLSGFLELRLLDDHQSWSVRAVEVLATS